MEEADQIIIVSFKQIGCKLPSEVESIRDFTPEVLVNAAATVVNLVEGTPAGSDGAFNPTLPRNVAGRHRLCQNLGKKIKELGYTGDAGYNQFLYPSERDTRKMLMWLVEKIPKSEEEKAEEVLGPDALLNRTILQRLDGWTKATWAPAVCDRYSKAGVRTPRYHRRSLHTARLSVADPRSKIAAKKAYDAGYLPLVSRQPAMRDDVAPSLADRNDAAVAEAAAREALIEAAGTMDLAEYKRQQRAALTNLLRTAFADAAAESAAAATKREALADVMGDLMAGAEGDGGRGTAFSHQTKFAQESAVSGAVAAAADVAEEEGESAEAKKARTEAALAKQREDELAELQARVDAAEAVVARAGALDSTATAKLRQAAAALASEKARRAELEKAYMVIRGTLDMLPEAARHIAELQKICADSAARLVTLAAEWETHRKPLLGSIRQHKESKAHRKDDCKRKVEDMRRMRGEMKSMADEIRAKEQRAKLLAEEYEKMPKDINRTLYTYRIMDIIKQNRKQKVEITKIIGHIREVQREINGVTEKLQRTEVVTDERVFQAASERNDQHYVALYRSLKDLREVFDQLIAIVQTGAHTENEARDLESRTKQLEQRTSASNQERIAADLAQVRKENEALVGEIKATRGR